MGKCSGIKYIDDTRTLVGYGDTKDSALNEMLDKLKVHEDDVKCAGACSSGDEVCRPFLNPPDVVKFRMYWRKSTGKIRWKCMWGPGVLEFECGCCVRSED
jgi:hypothetical protein